MTEIILSIWIAFAITKVFQSTWDIENITGVILFAVIYLAILLTIRHANDAAK